MKVLLLSAYDADSHQYWRQHLVANFPAYEWTQLVLPGRYFNWRIRGNSLQWALEQEAALTAGYDLIIATSMVDLSALKGFVPELARVPSLVYFHENQFAYPEGDKGQSFLEPKMVNLYTAFAADKLLFNSDYNRQSFLTGVAKLVKQLPEKLPGLVANLEAKSYVLPVPIQIGQAPAKACRKVQLIPQLVWNHRWEYDKGPELLLACMDELQRRNIAVKLHLLGQQFRRVPVALEELQQRHKGSLGQVGYVAGRVDYEALLDQADYVVSTADHEFQGLAVGEAVQYGCLPLLPDRLSYPGLVGLDNCFASGAEKPHSLAAQAEAFADKLQSWQSMAKDERLNRWQQMPVHDYHWGYLGPQYQQHIESLICPMVK